MRVLAPFFFFTSFVLTSLSLVWAAGQVPYGPAQFLAPLEKSQAYHRYLESGRRDRDRILFLLERFERADIQINYGGYHYDAKFAAKVARWFFNRMYKGQTSREWILQWCNRTVPQGKLIWVKFPDGSYRLGREVLFEELQALDRELAA